MAAVYKATDAWVQSGDTFSRCHRKSLNFERVLTMWANYEYLNNSLVGNSLVVTSAVALAAVKAHKKNLPISVFSN